MPPPPQKVQHIFCKCNLHAIQNCPPVIQRWQEPKRPLASSFFFFFPIFYFAALISHWLLLFHLPGDGKRGHFDKWTER